MKKNVSGQKARTLVAIHKRMVLDDAKRISRREIESDRFSASRLILRTGKRGCQKTGITQSCPAAILVQGGIMKS